MEKYVAIYVRRSVSDRDKGNNSLSIDSQKADCMKQLKKGEKYRLYCDDGKSGKDIAHRPEFQRMMDDAKAGLISRIVVKKYDRFSRNLREYLNVTDVLDRYGVSVISLTEPFNTETKEGRLMRNNLLNFAEFERETIAGRVADAYGTRAAETGFYQGGKVYYGYIPERRTVNGKTGSVLVPSDRADVPMGMLTLSTKTRIFHSAMYFRTSSKMALRSILTPKRTWTGAIYRKFSKVRFMFVRTKRYISILCQRVIALLTMWRLLTAFTAVFGINRRMVSIISK